MAITLLRGSAVSVPFSITDSGNALANKRVTFAVGKVQPRGVPVLTKVGGLPGSTSDVTVTLQNTQQITGTINIAAADYASLSEGSYVFTLWVDDGNTDIRCVTAAGQDTLTITETVRRT